jgi:hypothetical protein
MDMRSEQKGFLLEKLLRGSSSVYLNLPPELLLENAF